MHYRGSVEPSLVVSANYSTYPQSIDVEIGKHYLMVYANQWYQNWMNSFPPQGCTFTRLGGNSVSRGNSTCFVDTYFAEATANQIVVSWYGNDYPICFTLIALD